MIEAEGVSLRRGGRFVVDEVSISIRPGTLTAVLGPNGAGKSSLVRLLSGEAAPDFGKVTLDGRDLKHWDRRDLARRRAVLSQSVSLTFPLSVAEVVMLGRAPHRARSTRAGDMAAAEASLKAADVWHLAGRLYPTLSGGERQRVQFARVLAQLEDGGQSGSRYLILDEPTSSLDIRHQARLLGLASGLARKGWGVLVVLHDANLAAIHADTVVLLREGRILASGDPWSVMTPDRLTATFDHPVLVSRRDDLDRPLITPAAGLP
jgi:iron complex transport system ATP-binding protein